MKEEKLFDVIPCDPTSVNVDVVFEILSFIAKIGYGDNFNSKKIQEQGGYNRTTAVVDRGLFYLHKIRLLDKKGKAFSKSKSQEAQQLFKLFETNQIEEATESFKKYLFTFPLLYKIKAFFDEKQQRTIEEVRDYFNGFEELKGKTERTAYRKASFILALLGKMGVVHYNNRTHLVLWKNGVSQYVQPILVGKSEAKIAKYEVSNNEPSLTVEELKIIKSYVRLQKEKGKKVIEEVRTLLVNN